jgi:uncharacterized protein (TIRG00374 family)
VTRTSAKLRWAAAWILASALLLLCLRGVDWKEALAAAGRANPAWLAAAGLANVAIVVLWGAQWRLFLPRSAPVPFTRVLRITAVMAMTANSVPYLAGQAAGVHLLATRGGVGYATALSVATLDQVAEGIAKVTLLASLALLLPVPVPDPIRAALPIVCAGVAILALVTVLAAWKPGVLARGIGRWRGRRALAALAAGTHAWSRGLEAARRPGLLAAGVGVALLMKAAEAAGILAVQAALGVHVPVPATLVVLAAVSVATMLPLSPANLGVYEGAAFLAYRWAGVDAEAALALAVVQHLALLAAMGGSGWAAVTLRAARGKPGAVDPVRS